MDNSESWKMFHFHCLLDCFTVIFFSETKSTFYDRRPVTNSNFSKVKVGLNFYKSKGWVILILM